MKKISDGHLTVDKIGLRKLAFRRGAGWVVTEMLQNSLDENVTRVEISLEPVPHKSLARLRVEDDSPDGFRELHHAYTLFAESYKKSDPEKRGRFNLGEKLILAIAETASISTTTGTVEFTGDGRRIVRRRKKRNRGTVFEGILKLSREQLHEACCAAEKVLVPFGVEVRFNGEKIKCRTPIHSFDTTLETEMADEEGFLRKTRRKTTVRLFEPNEGEAPSLYEMGLPVMPTGDKWHVDVCQKIPLTLDRVSVPSSFLTKLRTDVLNEMNTHISQDDANENWVREATSDRRCSKEAITRTLDLRFGTTRVSFDPSDPEANNRAVAMGFKVQEAQQALGLAHRYYDDLQFKINRLANHYPTLTQLESYFRRLYPDPIEGNKTRAENTRQKLLALYETGRGMDIYEIRHTTFAALNAVTEYIDHHRPTRASTAKERASRRLQSQWFGSGARLKAKAWDLALQMTGSQ